MQAELFLIRHAEPFFPEGEPVYLGKQQDYPLSSKGREQAAALVPALKDRGITRICSSPLVRCLETAAPLAESLGLGITVLDDLAELDPGEWAGRSMQAVRDEYGEAFRNGTCFPPPGGETDEAGLERVKRVLALIRKEEGNTVLVSHGGLMRLMLGLMAGPGKAHIFNVRYADPLRVSVTAEGQYLPEARCFRTPRK